MKQIWAYLILALLLLQSFFLWKWIRSAESIPKVNRDVVAEHFEDVFELGIERIKFSEIYDYKAYEHWDLPFFRKKALIKVKADALVGFDLEGLMFDVDEDNHLIIIRTQLKPELLSLEHDLKYYDIQEGFFNSFTEDQLTSINKDAKSYIKNIVLDEYISVDHSREIEKLIDMLSMTFPDPWKVEYLPETP